MNTPKENFKNWYVDVLSDLYPSREAGFAILMISFPLLERYIKQKCNVPSQARLKDPFYNELQTLFPELPDATSARYFWQVYRNGILHEVTLSKKDRSGTQMPTGWLSHDRTILSIESNGDYWIHPALFAQRVVNVIDNDFSVFEGSTGSQSKLPKVKPGGPSALGTSTDP